MTDTTRRNFIKGAAAAAATVSVAPTAALAGSQAAPAAAAAVTEGQLSADQWLMIGAGALAVGGLGYWAYAKKKARERGAPLAPRPSPYAWATDTIAPK